MIGKAVTSLLIFSIILGLVLQSNDSITQKAFAQENTLQNYNFQPNLYAVYGYSYLVMQQQFPQFDPFQYLFDNQNIIQEAFAVGVPFPITDLQVRIENETSIYSAGVTGNTLSFGSTITTQYAVQQIPSAGFSNPTLIDSIRMGSAFSSGGTVGGTIKGVIIGDRTGDLIEGSNLSDIYFIENSTNTYDASVLTAGGVTLIFNFSGNIILDSNDNQIGIGLLLERTSGGTMALRHSGNTDLGTWSGFTLTTSGYSLVSGLSACGEDDENTLRDVSCNAFTNGDIGNMNVYGGNARAVLNWTAPSDNGDPITSYNIQRANQTTFAVFNEGQIGESTSLTLTKEIIGSDTDEYGIVGQRIVFPKDILLQSITSTLADGVTGSPFATSGQVQGVVVQGANGTSTITRIANSSFSMTSASDFAHYGDLTNDFSDGGTALTFGFSNVVLEGGVEYIIGYEVVTANNALSSASEASDGLSHPYAGLGNLTEIHSGTSDIWFDTPAREWNADIMGIEYDNETASTGNTNIEYTSTADFPSSDLKINAYTYLVKAINSFGLATPSNVGDISPDRSDSIDTWQYREVDERASFPANCIFNLETTGQRAINITEPSSYIASCYVFKSFPTSQITGSDIRIDLDINNGVTDPIIRVVDGALDKDNSTDFVPNRGVLNEIHPTLNQTQLLVTPVLDQFCTPTGLTFPKTCSVIIPASNILYGSATQPYITVEATFLDFEGGTRNNMQLNYIAIENIGSWNFTDARFIRQIDIGDLGLSNVLQSGEDDRGTVFSNSIFNGTVAVFPVPENFSIDQKFRKIAKLNWDAVASATEYQVFRNNTLLATTRMTDYDDTTLGSTAHATYKVRANFGAGFSDNTTSINFGYIQPITGLTATNATQSTIDLSWNLPTTSDPDSPLTEILVQKKNNDYISDNYEDRFPFENYTDAFTYYFDHGLNTGGAGTLSCPNFDARTGQLTGLINCVGLKVTDATNKLLTGGGTKSLEFNSTSRRDITNIHFYSIAKFNITKDIDEFAFDYKGVDSWAGGNVETTNADTQGWGVVFNYFNGTEKVYTDELIQRGRCTDHGGSSDYYVRDENFCNAVDQSVVTTAPSYRVNKFGQVDSEQLDVAVATNIARGVQTNVGGNITTIFTSNFGTASDFDTYVRDWELHIGSLASTSQSSQVFPDIRAHTGHSMIIDNLIFQYHNNTVVPFSNWSNVTTLSPTSTNYTVSSLLPNTQYDFRIVGITNPTGEFTYTSESTLGINATQEETDFTAIVDSVTLTSPPFPITTLLGSTVSNTCELSWTAPSDGNSPINGYKILRQATGEGSFSVLIANTTTTSTAYTDSGLVNGIIYQYDVRGLNIFGDSITSNIVDCQPVVGGVPNEPTNLDADEESNGDVTLTWNEPATGDPTGYRIERKVGQGSYVILTNNTGTPSLTYLDSTTSPAVEYTYRVAGWNAFGLDGYSNEATINTSNPPQAPVLSAVQNVNQIDLSWVAPFSDNPINGYKIDRRINLGSFTTLVANTTTTVTTYIDADVVKPNTYGYRVSALSSSGQGALSNVVDVVFGSHVVVQVREQDGSGFKGGGRVKILNSTFSDEVSLNSQSNAVFDNYPVANFNYTFFDNSNFILNKTFNFPFPSGNNTSIFTINALVFDVDCPANGAGADVRIKVNYTDDKDIFSFPSTPVCDSSDQVSWSTRWIGASMIDESRMVSDFISSLFRANAVQFLASSAIIPTTYSSGTNAITSDLFQVNASDTTINFNLFLGRAPAGGGGGGSGGGGSSAPVESGQSALPSTKIIIKDQLTGLSVLSRTHPFAKAGDVIQGTVTVQWEGESPLTITGINEKAFSEYIVFDLPPIPLEQRIVGIGDFAKSEADIPYSITLPADICDPEIGITQNCVNAELLDFPLEFEFDFEGVKYEASTDVFVDLSPIPFDIVQLQVILLGVGLIASALAGNYIRKKLKPKLRQESQRKKKFKKKFDAS